MNSPQFLYRQTRQALSYIQESLDQGRITTAQAEAYKAKCILEHLAPSLLPGWDQTAIEANNRAQIHAALKTAQAAAKNEYALRLQQAEELPAY